jgi:hypothetical protein
MLCVLPAKLMHGVARLLTRQQLPYTCLPNLILGREAVAEQVMGAGQALD